jgi:DNA-binding IclR family transcriptional regulator
MARGSSSRAKRTGTQTVDRSFQLLKEVAAQNAHGITLTELAGTLGLHRTTTHRLLQCLVRNGAIRHEAGSRRFFLGPLAVELSIAVRPQVDLRTLFAEAVSRVAEQTGDTTFLILRSGNDAVCIDRRLGSYPIKTVVVEVGTRRPLGIGAGSLAILSALPDTEMERVVRDNARRLKVYNKRPEALLKTVKAARKAGYTAGPVHGVDGAIALGVPVFDPGGVPVAGLSVAAISTRMTSSRQMTLLKILRSQALQMTGLLRDTNIVEHG